MAENETTTRFRVDISELQAGITQANRQIRLANSEFRAATDGMDDWSQSADGISANLTRLNNVLGSQRTVLSNLERQYQLTVDEMGAGSVAAQNLQIQINNQRAAIARTERDISNYEEQLENLGNNANDAGEDLENLGNDADGLGSKLGDLAKKGFAAVATAAASVVTAFLGSAEATREYREDIGKLQTAFETAGLPAETATEMYKDFFSVLGEEDRSVEAVNHLAKLTTNQEDLAKWTDICAGVWGTFGDSLPIEGLTEAANETAKVGQVTGPLADALNWAGISEDKFNDALTACNDEQERATLITDTLNALYAEAAENYKENNAAVMEAQRAQSELTDAMAAVGAVAEPVMTSLKLLGAEMLNGILPAVETLGEAFNGLLNGESGSGEAVGEAIGDIVNFAVEKISEMLPQLINAGVSLIVSLVDGILQAVPQLLSAILELVPDIIETLGEAIPQIVSAVVSGLYLIINAIIENAPAILTAAIEFFTGLVDAVPQIVEQLLSAIDLLISQLCNTLIEYIPELLDAAMQLFTAIIDAIPQIIQSLVTYLPEIVNTIVTFVVEAVPMLLDAAIQLFMALVDAIPEIVTALTDALPQLIDSILTAILDAVPELLDAAIQLLMAIIDAIPIIIDELVPVIPDIITTIVEILIDNIPTILDASMQLFMAIVEAIPEIIVELAKAVPQIVTSILEGLGSLASSLDELLGEAFNTFVEWGSDLISKGKKVAGDLFDAIVDKVDEIPGEMLSIGKNIVEGLWNGIKDMSSWIGKKIEGFGEGVLDGIKDFFGIASPSKVMKEEVGKNLAAGVGEGFEDGMEDTTKKVSKVNDEFLESLKVDMTDGQKELSEAAQKEQEAAAKEAAKTAEKLLKEQQAATDKAFQAQVNAEKTHAKELSDYLKSLTKEYETELSNIQKDIDSFQGKLTKSFTDMFTFKEDKNGNIIGAKTTDKIKESTKELEEYYKKIEELKKRGISDDLLVELAGMSIEEGSAVADYYASLTDAQLKSLEDNWNKYNDTAKKLADELYAGDVQRATDAYFTQVKQRLDMENDTMKEMGYGLVNSLVNAFDTNDPMVLGEIDRLTGSIETMLDEANLSTTPNAKYIGENLVDGIVEGFVSEMDASKSAIEAACGTLTDTIAGIFDIHSPSRVMEKLIGNNLMFGIAKGIEGKAQVAVDAMKSASQKLLLPAQSALSAFNATTNASAGANFGAVSMPSADGSIKYNFVQNNYSPKSLSRMEIYRQTKNQISLIKGVQNV